MRSAFTLIELMIIVAILSIVSAIIIPNIIKNKNNVTPGPAPIDINIRNTTYTSEKFELEGHSYLMITGRGHHGFTAVHNPECPKCHPVTVEKQNVER